MRAPVHIGLAVLLVVAPAFCCCHLRLLTALVVASDGPPHACCPISPERPARVAATSTCCQSAKAAKPARKSCRHHAEPAKKPAPKPDAPQPSRCCLDQRPDATPPESPPTVSAPQPTGELVPLAVVGLRGTSPEHLGLLGGLDPPEGAGVDTRSAALFARHVLRC
jgi:hypothetical protein